MISLWNTTIYEPLYNILIFIINAIPGHNVGIAIILLTILVKLVLYPLTGKSIKAQRAMKELEPELKIIRDAHKDDKQLQAKKTMELYQQRGVTPFSGCLPLLIQIPIIIGLYWVFMDLKIDPSILYNFVIAPETLNMHFLVFDLTLKSITLAALAGFTQYIQTDLSLGRAVTPAVSANKSEKPSFQEDFQKSMQVQMRYVLPVMISFIAYTTAGAVALYWTASNILSIIQELLMKRNTPKTIGVETKK